MKANLYSTSGKLEQEVTLPKGLFEVSVKPEVMAQAIRVLLSRQHTGAAFAKTRGDVNRTTAKVYAQKHTGRARHGARSAPIYVGGGVAHGPKGILPAPLKLTKKMRRLSVLGALSQQGKNHAVSLVSGLDKTPPKANAISSLMQTVAAGQPTLVLTAQSYPEFQRAAANLPTVSLMPATAVNAVKILKAKHLLIDQSALPAMETWLQAKSAPVAAPAKAATKVAKPAVKKAVKTVTKTAIKK